MAPEKRAGMATGGGPFSSGAPDNPIIDLTSNVVDIPNVIRVEASQCSEFALGQDEVLVPIELSITQPSKKEQPLDQGKDLCKEYFNKYLSIFGTRFWICFQINVRLNVMF